MTDKLFSHSHILDNILFWSTRHTFVDDSTSVCRSAILSMTLKRLHLTKMNVFYIWQTMQILCYLTLSSTNTQQNFQSSKCYGNYTFWYCLLPYIFRHLETWINVFIDCNFGSATRLNSLFPCNHSIVMENIAVSMHTHKKTTGDWNTENRIDFTCALFWWLAWTTLKKNVKVAQK